MAKLIDADALEDQLGVEDLDIAFKHLLRECPGVEAIALTHGYKIGDVCFYGFCEKNPSLALVEIVRILDDDRGCAEVKFLKVFVDETGNGWFNYLLKSGNTMNASFKYLKNVTPIAVKRTMNGG